MKTFLPSEVPLQNVLTALDPAATGRRLSVEREDFPLVVVFKEGQLQGLN